MTLNGMERFFLGCRPTWTDIQRDKELREQIQITERRIKVLAGKDEFIQEKVILEALLREQSLLQALLEFL